MSVARPKGTEILNNLLWGLRATTLKNEINAVTLKNKYNLYLLYFTEKISLNELNSNLGYISQMNIFL